MKNNQNNQYPNDELGYEYNEPIKESIQPKQQEIYKSARDLYPDDNLGYEYRKPTSNLGIGEPITKQELGRTAARAGESILGLPGNIGSTVMGLVSKATGGKIPDYEQLQEKKLGVLLPPTSEQLREKVTKELFGEALEPITDKEKLFDKVVGDVAPIFTGGLPGGFMNFIKGALGLGVTSTIGNVASEELNKQGFSPTSQALTKFLIMQGGSLAGTKRQLRNTMKDDYKIAQQSIQGQPTPKLTTDIKNLELIKRSLADKDFIGKSTAMNRIKEAQKLLHRQPSINQIWERKKELNDMIFKGDLNDKVKPVVIATKKVFDDILKNVGKSNEQFATHFNRAENINAGLSNASAVTEFLNKHVSLKKLATNPHVQALLGIGSLGHHVAKKGVGGILGMAGTVAKGGALLGTAGFGAREVAKMVDLLKTSKVAREAYAGVFKNALKQNLPATAKVIAKLNHEANKGFEFKESEET